MKKQMLALLAVSALVATNASAALAETSLTAGIDSAIGSATTIITTGFGVTALFILARLMKRGAYTATK